MSPSNQKFASQPIALGKVSERNENSGTCNFETVMGSISNEEAFIAGILSGAVLGCDSNIFKHKDIESGKVDFDRVYKNIISIPKDRLLCISIDALNRLRNEVTCSVCWNTIKEPISLQCGHSFCNPCIATWTRSKPSCPICRCPTLSYRSYSENLALSGLMRGLGLSWKSSREEKLIDWKRFEIPQRLRNNLFNQVRTYGRIRQQASNRYPWQSEILNRLRIREETIALQNEARNALIENLRNDERFISRSAEGDGQVRTLDRALLEQIRLYHYRMSNSTLVANLLDEIRTARRGNQQNRLNPRRTMSLQDVFTTTTK